MTRRRGSTLVELVVVIAIMAIVAAVVAFALQPEPAPADDFRARIAEARRAAVSARAPVTIEVERGGARYLLTALPDGGVVADSGLSVDRLSGEQPHARPE